MQAESRQVSSGDLKFYPGRQFSLVLTIPFWLEEGTRPLKGTDRLDRLRQAGYRIHSNLQNLYDDHIHLNIIDQTNRGDAYPDRFLERKGGFLVIQNKDENKTIESMPSSFISDKIICKKTNEKIVYYDYGLGYIEVILEMSISSIAGRKQFEEWYECFRKDIVSRSAQSRCYFAQEFRNLSNYLRLAFKAERINLEMWLAKQIDRDSEICWSFSISLFFSAATKENSPFSSIEDLDALRSLIIGHDPDLQEITPNGLLRPNYFYSDYLYFSCGGTGSLVIFHKEQAYYSIDRIRNVHGFFWMFYAIFIEVMEAIFNIQKQLVNEEDRKIIKRNYNKLGRDVVDLLRLINYEATPRGIEEEEIDSFIYRQSWLEFGGDTIIAEVNEQLASVTKAIERLQSEYYETITKRITITVFVLTIIQGLGTILSGFDFIDFNNHKENNIFRLEYLSMTAFVALISLLLLLWFRRR